MNTTRIVVFNVLVFIVLLLIGCRHSTPQNQPLDHNQPVVKINKPVTADPHRWDKDIAKFQQFDINNPPVKNAVLFLGSSSIRLWDLKKYFHSEPCINRGFGGSHISDSVFFADKLVKPYNPRLIIFYAGDNDIASGKSPQTLLDDFKQLVNRIHAWNNSCPIIYITIKPSTSRWKFWPQVQQANSLIMDYCKTDTRLSFLDVTPYMLGPDGMPITDLYATDGLHLSPKGYTLWSSLLKPYLE